MPMGCIRWTPNIYFLGTFVFCSEPGRVLCSNWTVLFCLSVLKKYSHTNWCITRYNITSAHCGTTCRGWWPPYEPQALGFSAFFEGCCLFCAWLGLEQDWCKRTVGSWVEFLKSWFVSQTTRRFWNDVSFSERSLLCNSGILIPASKRPRRATSRCPSKLHLDAWRWRWTINSRTVSLGFRIKVWNLARSTSSNCAGLTWRRNASCISVMEASLNVLGYTWERHL